MYECHATLEECQLDDAIRDLLDDDSLCPYCGDDCDGECDGPDGYDDGDGF